MTDAAARRLPEFIKTLRINRAKRRESVYASDNVYALLDACDAAEAHVRELEAQLAEAYERAARVCDGWLAAFGHCDIQYVGARTYASDAVKDIATAIRKLAQEVKHEAE